MPFRWKIRSKAPGPGGEAPAPVSESAPLPAISADTSPPAGAAAVQRTPEPPQVRRRTEQRPTPAEPASPADAAFSQQLQGELRADAEGRASGILGRDGGFANTAVFASETQRLGEQVRGHDVFDEVSRAVDAPPTLTDPYFADSLSSLMSFSDPLAIIDGRKTDTILGARVSRKEELPSAISELWAMRQAGTLGPSGSRATGPETSQARRPPAPPAEASPPEAARYRVASNQEPVIRRLADSVSHESRGAPGVPSPLPIVARSTEVGTPPTAPAAAAASPAPRLARDEPLPPSSAGAGTVVARETFRARPAPATEVARSVEAGSAPPPLPMADVIRTPAAERPSAEPAPPAVPRPAAGEAVQGPLPPQSPPLSATSAAPLPALDLPMASQTQPSAEEPPSVVSRRVDAETSSAAPGAAPTPAVQPPSSEAVLPAVPQTLAGEAVPDPLPPQSPPPVRATGATPLPALDLPMASQSSPSPGEPDSVVSRRVEAETVTSQAAPVAARPVPAAEAAESPPAVQPGERSANDAPAVQPPSSTIATQHVARVAAESEPAIADTASDLTFRDAQPASHGDPARPAGFASQPPSSGERTPLPTTPSAGPPPTTAEISTSSPPPVGAIARDAAPTAGASPAAGHTSDAPSSIPHVPLPGAEADSATAVPVTGIRALSPESGGTFTPETLVFRSPDTESVARDSGTTDATQPRGDETGEAGATGPMQARATPPSALEPPTDGAGNRDRGAEMVMRTASEALAAEAPTFPSVATPQADVPAATPNSSDSTAPSHQNDAAAETGGASTALRRQVDARPSGVTLPPELPLGPTTVPNTAIARQTTTRLGTVSPEAEATSAPPVSGQSAAFHDTGGSASVAMPGQPFSAAGAATPGVEPTGREELSVPPPRASDGSGPISRLAEMHDAPSSSDRPTAVYEPSSDGSAAYAPIEMNLAADAGGADPTSGGSAPQAPSGAAGEAATSPETRPSATLTEGGVLPAGTAPEAVMRVVAEPPASPARSEASLDLHSAPGPIAGESRGTAPAPTTGVSSSATGSSGRADQVMDAAPGPRDLPLQRTVEARGSAGQSLPGAGTARVAGVPANQQAAPVPVGADLTLQRALDPRPRDASAPSESEREAGTGAQRAADEAPSSVPVRPQGQAGELMSTAPLDLEVVPAAPLSRPAEPGVIGRTAAATADAVMPGAALPLRASVARRASGAESASSPAIQRVVASPPPLAPAPAADLQLTTAPDRGGATANDFAAALAPPPAAGKTASALPLVHRLADRSTAPAAGTAGQGTSAWDAPGVAADMPLAQRLVQRAESSSDAPQHEALGTVSEESTSTTTTPAVQLDDAEIERIAERIWMTVRRKLRIERERSKGLV